MKMDGESFLTLCLLTLPLVLAGREGGSGNGSVPDRHGSPCDRKGWESHVEPIYDKDRRSLEGFNAFLRAVVERNYMEAKLDAEKVEREKLCDFGHSEFLYCDAQKETCECGSKWQNLETALVEVRNGSWECRALLDRKCRWEEESPFKQFKGWSPCQPGSRCHYKNNTKDIILQRVPRYGVCTCDLESYDGTKRPHPIHKCQCALVPCRQSSVISSPNPNPTLILITYYLLLLYLSN